MKKFAVLLTMVLVVTSFAAVGCGRAEPNPDSPMPRPVPHSLDVMHFDNCNVCHVGDQLSVTNIIHNDFTNDSCTQAGCHGERVYTEPNTLPVARTIPHIVTSPLDNCIACHLPSKTGNIIPHSMYSDNSLCLNPACHAASGAPPITPTQPVVTPTDPVSPPSSTSSGGAPVLDKAAVALAANHAAYKNMCVMCHNAGAVGDMLYPLAPEWAGSTLSPGPWTVTAGSAADHTGRNDNDGCTVAGCHSW